MKNGLVVFIYLCFVLVSCSENKLDVDVSDVKVDMRFDRFEEKMFDVQTQEGMKSVNEELIEVGGELYEFYVYDMLRSGSVYDDSISKYLWYFVTDSIMKKTADDIAVSFADFGKVENDLMNAFKHQKYHLPNAPLPKQFITYNGAYNYGVVSTDSVVGIGLEMYLGADNRVIEELPFPVYVREKMDKKYLTVDVVQSWLTTNVIEFERGETFLSSLLYFGKLKYAMQAMLPNTELERIVRYTKEEYDYALASEYNIWQYLVDMNWIYTTDMKVKIRFFEEAPTTVGIDESPGRIGQFIGWQMVKAYMDKYPDVSLSELLDEKNESKILKAYKPQPNE